MMTYIFIILLLHFSKKIDNIFSKFELSKREVLMAENIVHVTDENFEQEVIKADLPTLVDFWAPWCGPCHMVSPILEEIVEEYAGRFKLAKLNVDNAPETAARYGIRAIPSMLLFKDGEVAAQTIGAQPKQALLKVLAPHLG
jgi:thioredoxin 1